MMRRRRRQRIAAAAMQAPVRRRIVREHWVHPLLQEREGKGEMVNLIQELRGDEEKFYEYFRMVPETFDYLHALIHQDIKKADTNFRRALPTDLKLAATLRYILQLY
jgi:hypothetical protein